MDLERLSLRCHNKIKTKFTFPFALSSVESPGTSRWVSQVQNKTREQGQEWEGDGDPGGECELMGLITYSPRQTK